jgi:Tfp pilus assembly protein PilE
MRTLAIAVIVASMAVPAYAQRNQVGNARAAKVEAAKKKEAQEIEKAYNNTVKRIPDQSTKPKDPWGNIR